jgi:hypothetical protein
MMSANTQETEQIKKSVVYSFKLQQACEDKLHFILACPCTSKHLHLRHREACIKGIGWDLLHPQQLLQHTTCDPTWMQNLTKANGKYIYENLITTS